MKLQKAGLFSGQRSNPVVTEIPHLISMIPCYDLQAIVSETVIEVIIQEPLYTCHCLHELITPSYLLFLTHIPCSTLSLGVLQAQDISIIIPKVF